MRVGAHAACTERRQCLQLRDEAAAFVEQSFGPVAAHPALEDFEMRGIGFYAVDGDLVRAPKTFDLLAVDFLRAGPSLRAAQHDHRPARTLAAAVAAGRALDVANAIKRQI